MRILYYSKNLHIPLTTNIVLGHSRDILDFFELLAQKRPPDLIMPSLLFLERAIFPLPIQGTSSKCKHGHCERKMWVCVRNFLATRTLTAYKIPAAGISSATIYILCISLAIVFGLIRIRNNILVDFYFR